MNTRTNPLSWTFLCLSVIVLTRPTCVLAGTPTTFTADYSYWDITSNWSPAYPNGTGWDPLLLAGRTALIRNAAPACGIVYIGQSTSNPRRGFLEILPGGSLDALQVLVGHDNSNVGTVYHCGGNVIARDACRVGSGSGCSGYYYLSAGTLRKSSGEPLYVGYSGYGLLQITHNGTCHATGITIANSSTAAGSLLEQRGGSVVIADNLDIGSTATANAFYLISGGSLVWSNTCTVRGGFTVKGGTADIFTPASGTPLSFASTGFLHLIFDAKGISPIRVPNGTISVNSSTKLVIDGNLFTRAGGRPGSYLLLQYASLPTQFSPANVTFTGFGLLTPSLRYTSNALYLDLTASNPNYTATAQGIFLAYCDMPINMDGTSDRTYNTPINNVPNMATWTGLLVRTHSTWGKRVPTIDLTYCGRTANIIARFYGYLDVPAAGTYTFYVTCDDGAKLWINNTLVVNNDGIKSAPATASGSIALNAGTQPIELIYFNNTGTATLSVEWEGPGLSRQLIASQYLFSEPEKKLEGTDYEWNEIMPDEERRYNYCPSFVFDDVEGLYKIWSGGLSNTPIAGDYILYKQAPTLEGLANAVTRIALAPTGVNGTYDRKHACDPNVYRDGNTFYLTYTGNPEDGYGTGLPDTSFVMMASSDNRGRTFTRLHGGLPILYPPPSATNCYGFGQSAVVKANDGYWYMIYTHNPTVTSNYLAVVRCDDPSFPSNKLQHVKILFNFSAEIASYSVDLAYDKANGRFIVIGNLSSHPTTVKMRMAFYDANWNFITAHEVVRAPNFALGEGIALLMDLDKQIFNYQHNGVGSYVFAAATYEDPSNTTLWAPWVEGDTKYFIVPQPSSVNALPAPLPVGIGEDLTGRSITTGFYPPVSNKFTIDFWVYPTGFIHLYSQKTNGIEGTQAGFGYAVAPDYGGSWGDPALNAGVGVAVGKNGVAVYEHTAGYLPPTLVYPTILDGWTHIAVVHRKPNLPRLYINGHYVHAGLVSPITYTRPSANWFGNYSYGPFYGRVWRYRVWNRDLTPSEIAGLVDDSSLAALKSNQSCNFLDYGPVREGAPIGTHVFTAALAGASANLSYDFFLPDDSAERFNVDPAQGHVQVFKGFKIDFESAKTNPLVLSAAIAGTNAASPRTFEIPVLNGSPLPYADIVFLRHYFNGSTNRSTPLAPAGITNNFSISLFAKPELPTYLPPEGSLVLGQQNPCALFPDHGSSWGDANLHAGAGIAIGTNGITVIEHGNNYFHAQLVWRSPRLLTNWMHVAVVYTNRTPRLFVNGVLVKTGLQSSRIVHPSSTYGGISGYYYKGYLAEARRANFAWSLANVQTACVHWALAAFPNSVMHVPAHEVTSNTTLSTIIAQYRAYPETPGASCSYSFIWNPGNLFTINAGNGAVTLTQLNNLEPNTNYTVVVRLSENPSSTNALTIYTSSDVIPEPAAFLSLIAVLLSSYIRHRSP